MSRPSKDSTSPTTSTGPVAAIFRVLETPLWPRTIRTMIGSTLFPWLWARLGRKRVDTWIAGTNLPEPVAGLVSQTVRRTRLWPHERMDVAHELAAHFADGLHAGRAEADLLRDFGDVPLAARLIRRAKIRARPWWWHSWKWSVRAAGTLTLLILCTYIWLAARYYLASPTIKHNFAAEINAPILKIPADQRAWTIYVRAISEAGPLPEWHRKYNWPNTPSEEHWTSGVEWLDAHAAALNTLRSAAAMPVLGYIVSGQTDPDFNRALEVRTPEYTYRPDLETNTENPLLLGVLLPYLGEVRNDARLLRFDARVAMQRNDPARFIADTDAILGMVSQCAQNKTFIDTLVAVAIGHLATDLAMEGLSKPGFLRDDDLTHLGHRLAGAANGRISFDPMFEKMSFDDIAQRFFSDNGRGDGHLIHGDTDMIYRDFGVALPASKSIVRAVAPVRGAIAASRARLTELNGQYLAAVSRDDALPLWRQDERGNGAEQRALYEEQLSAVFPLTSLMSEGEDSYIKQFAARDLFEARRWATMTACALERYKRLHGSYPDTLAALVPAMLPALPIDPFDGQPLRYRPATPASPKPILYSVGADQKDDGGRVPADLKHADAARDPLFLAAYHTGKVPKGFSTGDLELAHGDWVLYPPAPPTPPHTDTPK